MSIIQLTDSDKQKWY